MKLWLVLITLRETFKFMDERSKCKSKRIEMGIYCYHTPNIIQFFKGSYYKNHVFSLWSNSLESRYVYCICEVHAEDGPYG